MPSPLDSNATSSSGESVSLPCVMAFNANDPSGAGGLGADVAAMSSASAHVLPVVTGAYVRDSSDIHGHIAFDEEAVDDQARCALEDMAVQAIKVGGLYTAETASVAAQVATGNKMNCGMRPQMTALGSRATRLKSSRRSSKATENTMVAKTMLKTICEAFMFKTFVRGANSRASFAV